MAVVRIFSPETRSRPREPESRTPDNTHLGQLKNFACRTPFCPATCSQNWPLSLSGIRTDHAAKFDGLFRTYKQCQKRLEIVVFATSSSQKARWSDLDTRETQIRPDSSYFVFLRFPFFLSSSMTVFTSGTSLFNNENVAESPWESTGPVEIKVGDCERATKNWSNMIRAYSFTWSNDNCSGHSLNIVSGAMRRTRSNNWTTM